MTFPKRAGRATTRRALSPRRVREVLAQARAKLKQQKGEPISIRELCDEAAKIETSVKPHYFNTFIVNSMDDEERAALDIPAKRLLPPRDR